MLTKIRKIFKTTWFHNDRHATSEWRRTQSHEIQQHHGRNTGFPILPMNRPPAHAASLLSIQPPNCPKEKGEGRYESAYLLAFVQWAALSVRVVV